MSYRDRPNWMAVDAAEREFWRRRLRETVEAAQRHWSHQLGRIRRDFFIAAPPDRLIGEALPPDLYEVFRLRDNENYERQLEGAFFYWYNSARRRFEPFIDELRGLRSAYWGPPRLWPLQRPQPVRQQEYPFSDAPGSEGRWVGNLWGNSWMENAEPGQLARLREEWSSHDGEERFYRHWVRRTAEEDTSDDRLAGVAELFDKGDLEWGVSSQSPFSKSNDHWR